MDKNQIQTLLEILVRALVDTPEKVYIKQIQGPQTLVYEVSVDKSDLGKVIGKSGEMAKALRRFLMALSTKAKLRTVLIIEE